MGATLSYAGCEADVAATVVKATISGGFRIIGWYGPFRYIIWMTLEASIIIINNAKADQGAGAMYA